MRHKLSLFVGVFCLLIPFVAEATVVLPLDFRQLTGKAVAIVHGRIITVAPQWATDRPGIETMVTVEVANYLKGDLGPLITFRVPGGKIGRFRSVTVGAPVFREGEEVVLFLGAAGPAIPRVVGFNQGVYRVTVDRASGARLVMPPLLSGEVTAPAPIVRGDPSRKPVPLEQFEAQVRSIVAGARGPREERVGDSGKRLRK